jgi:hypothetical protein
VRLTRIGGFHVDVNPRQTLIVLTNRDVPGVIGRVGTLLGTAGVNIAEYHQARMAQGGEALAVISVDGTVDGAVRQQLCAVPTCRAPRSCSSGSSERSDVKIRDVLRLLHDDGWELVRTRGSHRQYKHPTKPAS